MFKFNLKWWAAAAVACTLLAGCGGGGSDDFGSRSSQQNNPAASAQGVVNFLFALIANETSDMTEPLPLEGIALATEELSEPSPI